MKEDNIVSGATVRNNNDGNNFDTHNAYLDK